MRELSKVEMQEVSGAGLLGTIADTIGAITDVTVNTVADMVSSVTNGIANSIGSVIGLGVGYFDKIGKIFGR